jgi:hypothetical protein
MSDLLFGSKYYFQNKLPEANLKCIEKLNEYNLKQFDRFFAK